MSNTRHRYADLEEENRRLRATISSSLTSAMEPAIERARERDEEFAELWALVASQPNGEVRIYDRERVSYRKGDCILESSRDEANRCTVVRAVFRREVGAE